MPNGPTEFLPCSATLRIYMTPLPIAFAVMQHGLPALLLRAGPAFAVTVSFALIAWGLRSVTISGALAGAVATFVVFLSMGMEGFIAVLVVFLVTYISTHMGSRQKERLGIIQSGGRSGSQVLANLAAAAIACVPAIWFPRVEEILFVGACAALAEAAADTASSEVGQAFRSRAYLITNLRPVKIGQNGGISFLGTLAGVMAASIVALSCVWLELMPARWFGLVLLAGTLGMLFDSLLGATLECPGRLGNDSVNFVSTVFAAFLGILVSFVLY